MARARTFGMNYNKKAGGFYPHVFKNRNNEVTLSSATCNGPRMVEFPVWTGGTVYQGGRTKPNKPKPGNPGEHRLLYMAGPHATLCAVVTKRPDKSGKFMNCVKQ